MFNDTDTLEEMLTFIYDDKGRPDAMPGKHDDFIMADAIANEIRMQQSFEDKSNHRKIDYDKLRKMSKDCPEDWDNANEQDRKMIAKNWNLYK